MLDLGGDGFLKKDKLVRTPDRPPTEPAHLTPDVSVRAPVVKSNTSVTLNKGTAQLSTPIEARRSVSPGALTPGRAIVTGVLAEEPLFPDTPDASVLFDSYNQSE